MDKYNLNRFIEAQVDSYESAMSELSRGRKSGHWILYIFPQIEVRHRDPVLDLDTT